MRTGVVTKKLGMSMFFDEQGRAIPVTLLKLDDCQVVGHRNNEKDGVVAVRIGYGKLKANKITKPLKGYFKKQKVDFKRNIADFKVSQDALLDVGTYINANHYVAGQFIDATGISKGKGFAGVMKRYGFKGLRASHGVSISHRAHGSTGHCQDPGKVFKGKKMAGHMGATRITVSNLEIIQVDEENNILVVKGAVPGVSNSYVLVNDAKKRGLSADVPYPGVKAVHENKSENTKDASVSDGSETKSETEDNKSVDSTSSTAAAVKEISQKDEEQVTSNDEKAAVSEEKKPVEGHADSVKDESNDKKPKS